MSDTWNSPLAHPVIRRSSPCGELIAALAKAQGAMKQPTKNRENPHFRSKYAELSTVIDAIKPALAENGIAVFPSTFLDDAGLTLTMQLALGEQWIEGDLTIPLGKPDAQGMGSTLTYARRYLLSALCNVASEDDDDDGNAATRSVDRGATQAPLMASQGARPSAPRSGPAKLAAPVLSALRKHYAEIGAKDADIVQWVLKATDGRTERLDEVYSSESAALKTQHDKWLSYRGDDGKPVPLIEESVPS